MKGSPLWGDVGQGHAAKPWTLPTLYMVLCVASLARQQAVWQALGLLLGLPYDPILCQPHARA